MHMICPRLDIRNPFPHLGGFTFAAFGWKWQRSKVVTVDDHTRAALHDAASDWKPVDREIEAFWSAHQLSKTIAD